MSEVIVAFWTGTGNTAEMAEYVAEGIKEGGAEGVSKGFDKNGLGAIVNSSRGVMCAYKKEENCDEHDFAKAARREVIRMKEDIISYLPKISLDI